MQPTKIRALRDERILELSWPDGVIHRLPFKHLRCECPCASCVHEFTGQRLIHPENVPDDVAPLSMDLTGNYALKIIWSDGHSSGIFAWDVLRKIGNELVK